MPNHPDNQEQDNSCIGISTRFLRGFSIGLVTLAFFAKRFPGVFITFKAPIWIAAACVLLIAKKRDSFYAIGACVSVLTAALFVTLLEVMDIHSQLATRLSAGSEPGPSPSP